MASTPQITPIVPRGKNNPPVAAGDPIEVAMDVGPLASLVAFSIRNGDVSLARSLVIEPTISSMYHWCPISGLDHNRAIGNVGAFIRVAFAQINLGAPENITGPQKRKMAIILGVVRAVVTELYEVTDSDLVPGERATPMLVTVTGADGEITFEAVHGLEAEALQTGFVFTVTERAAMAAIRMCAIGLPACQGFSLLMTGRHYLSDAKSQSRRCFKAIEGAFWTNSAVREWFDEDVELIRDTMWHKACHPIVKHKKTSAAQSLAVKEMIVNAGAGAAASRLPALEPELRRAKSYRTLLQTVRPMYEEAGGAINYIVLDEAISVVESYPMGLDVDSHIPHGYPTVPISVTSRESAIKHLQNVCNKCVDVAGHAWGFFVAMDDRAQMLSGTAKVSTLRTSYSLSKLDTVSPAAYWAGMSFYEDYAAMKAVKKTSFLG